MAEKKQTTIVAGVSESKTFIRGPLGIWFFPLLNAILQFIHALKKMNYEGSSGSSKKVYQLIRDEKGRIVEVVEVEL